MGLYLCVFASPDTDDELGWCGGRLVRRLRPLPLDRRAAARGWSLDFEVPGPDVTCRLGTEWPAQDAATLSHELATIETELANLPAIELADGWQTHVVTSIGLVPASAAQSFIDVDGEPLLRRLRDLADLAAERGLPISFQ